MWKSLKEYVAALGYWGLIVIAPILLNALGIYQIVSNTQVLNIPSWVWFQIALVLILIVPFVAFHKMRIRLQGVTESRAQELARLILQVRNAAGKTVMLYHTRNDFDNEVKDAYKLYETALDSLQTEAEIDGGKVKEAIQEGFTGFVSFHVTRFLAWNGRIISDSDTRQKIEIDEYQFIGHMAGRADKTIQNIRALMR